MVNPPLLTLTDQRLRSNMYNWLWRRLRFDVHAGKLHRT